jgi:hypothetical protein
MAPGWLVMLILSRRHSRDNRSSASRHSAEAQVRRAVVAAVASNQVLPTYLSIARKRRGHGRVCPGGGAVFDGQECTRRLKQVREFDVQSGSSRAGFSLETGEAKLGYPFVVLGYVRVDGKFWSAQDRFQICCRA